VPDSGGVSTPGGTSATETHPASGQSRDLPTSAWDAPLYCHVPGDRSVDLEALADTRDGGDRWNEPGEPTAYVSCDVGVALVELGRHAAAEKLAAPKRLLRLELRSGALARLVDLRAPVVLRTLALETDPGQFLDREHARAVARRLRADSAAGYQGLIVPSMGLLDTPERCNLVVFADRIDGGMPGAVEAWTSPGEVKPAETPVDA